MSYKKKEGTNATEIRFCHTPLPEVHGEDEGYLSCRRVVGPRLWQAEVIRGATLVTKEVTPSSHKSSVDILPPSQLAAQPGTD